VMDAALPTRRPALLSDGTLASAVLPCFNPVMQGAYATECATRNRRRQAANRAYTAGDRWLIGCNASNRQATGDQGGTTP